MGAAGCTAAYLVLVPAKYLPPLSCPLLAVFAIASRRGDRRKQQVRFSGRFGTLDNFREAAGTGALRRLCDERGVAVAVDGLQQQCPRLSPATAAPLVKEL